MKYQKEFEAQEALGTLPVFIVERIDCNVRDCKDENGKINNLFLQLDEKGNKSYFLATVIRAINPTDAINRTMKVYNFPEEVRQYLHAYVYIKGRNTYNDSWINSDD